MHVVMRTPPRPPQLPACLPAHDDDGGGGGVVSPRGAGIKLFGPDRVRAFCHDNDIDVIIRYHLPPSQRLG